MGVSCAAVKFSLTVSLGGENGTGIMANHRGTARSVQGALSNVVVTGQA